MTFRIRGNCPTRVPRQRKDVVPLDELHLEARSRAHCPSHPGNSLVKYGMDIFCAHLRNYIFHMRRVGSTWASPPTSAGNLRRGFCKCGSIGLWSCINYCHQLYSHAFLLLLFGCVRARALIWVWLQIKELGLRSI